jgi:VIT1/CCC1 family predicted Fe2+/Mn2+ transporter
MLKVIKETFLIYMRNFIFGVEDGLVSTVGLLAGIDSAGALRSNIIKTGVILILVEAFSMAVGSFLTEQSTEEYGITGKAPLHRTIMAGIIMLGSYFVAGLIPLLPYLLIEGTQAFIFSIALSLVALLILGIVSAEVLKTKISRNAIRMLVIGGLAVSIGVVVGQLIK